MPKLLQLNCTANWGSTGRIAEGIGYAAIEQGWDSTIAYGRHKNPSQSELVQVGKKSDVYLHYARHRLFDQEGMGSKAPTRRLIDFIEKYTPDIIQLHNIHDHWLNYPLLFKYLATAPTHIVWTFHDCWPFTGGCVHPVEAQCSQWQEGCRKCRRCHNLLANTSNNYAAKLNIVESLNDRLHIVSVSQWLDSLVVESMFKNCDRHVIYNGVDVKQFKPLQDKDVDIKYNLNGKRVFLAVSNVWPESKGYSDYLKLSKLIPDDCVIFLVGLKQEQINALPNNMRGINRTDSISELTALYTRADAVLSLSKAETFGLTLAEGLSCGTPCLGYNSTAKKELMHDPIGWGCEFGNLHELAEVIKVISEDKLKFDSDVCREYAVNSFNSTTQYNKYIELYSNLLQK